MPRNSPRHSPDTKNNPAAFANSQVSGYLRLSGGCKWRGRRRERGAQLRGPGDRQLAGEIPADVSRGPAVDQAAASQQRNRLRASPAIAGAGLAIAGAGLANAGAGLANAGPGSPTAITAPGGAASRAVWCSSAVRSSSRGPMIAISAGPLSSASATASPEPAARGYRTASAGSAPSALPAASRWRAEPVRAA